MPDPHSHNHDHTHDCHSHGHVHGATSGAMLWVSLFITLAFVVGETIAGTLADSLALLSDAGHNFSDALALGLAAYAIWVARRPPNAQKTFGYHRVAILTALFNAATLLFIALSILVEAYRLFLHPEPVNGTLMIGVAAVAFLMNTVIAYGLHESAKESLNMRAAFIHMAGDAASSLAVVIAGFIVKGTGWIYADPVVSVFIALFIIYSGWGIITETTSILLEGTPKGLEIDKMVEAMRRIDRVEAVHDLHAWTVSDGLNYLSCHVVVADTCTMPECARTVDAINRLLSHDFGIVHSTIQMEMEGCCAEGSGAPLFCGETVPQA